MTDDFSRYVRQMRFAPFGEAGQRRLAESTVLLCGCGALGTVLANTLARAGVGRLRLVDRDFLELNNLQRQVLYDEQDVADGLPKAIAAANKLRRVNSQITIEPVVADVHFGNLAALAEGCDLLLDGTDNFETRFLLNDYALAYHVPWIYGGVIGAEGRTMTIVPGETACLRCVLHDAPSPGETPTCDTAGVLGGAVNVVASIQAVEAMKLLAGRRDAINRGLTIFDLWTHQFRHVRLDKLAAAGDCPACGRREFDWLEGRRGSEAVVLCGRNAVQLRALDATPISFDAVERKLAGVATITRNRFLLRADVERYRITLFADGRAIIGGVDDVAEAKTIYARFLGA